MTDECATCFFYFPSDRTCRHDAPVIVEGITTLWPSVEPTDWCADFSLTAKQPSGTHGAGDVCATCNHCSMTGPTGHVCHFRAPVLVRGRDTIWPPVQAADWCADFSLSAKSDYALTIAQQALTTASAAWTAINNAGGKSVGTFSLSNESGKGPIAADVTSASFIGIRAVNQNAGLVMGSSKSLIAVPSIGDFSVGTADGSNVATATSVYQYLAWTP